jgi:hypothetical protein
MPEAASNRDRGLRTRTPAGKQIEKIHDEWRTIFCFVHPPAGARASSALQALAATRQRTTRKTRRIPWGFSFRIRACRPVFLVQRHGGRARHFFRVGRRQWPRQPIAWPCSPSPGRAHRPFPAFPNRACRGPGRGREKRPTAPFSSSAAPILHAEPSDIALRRKRSRPPCRKEGQTSPSFFAARSGLTPPHQWPTFSPAFSHWFSLHVLWNHITGSRVGTSTHRAPKPK